MYMYVYMYVYRYIIITIIVIIIIIIITTVIIVGAARVPGARFTTKGIVGDTLSVQYSIVIA